MTRQSSVNLARRQRSHLLLTLTNARVGHEDEFLQWYRSDYLRAVQDVTAVLEAQLYERHEVDISLGQNPQLPFRYLGIIELSLDGAHGAEELIEKITDAHRQQRAAEAPATWLYFPAGEKVGRLSAEPREMLTIAFANGLPGRDDEFREWYATRHIRHALNIPALISGQCFARTLFQRPGAAEPEFSMIAVYEQEGTPEDIIESFKTLPPEMFDFPSADWSRFSEAVYRRL